MISEKTQVKGKLHHVVPIDVLPFVVNTRLSVTEDTGNRVVISLKRTR